MAGDMPGLSRMENVQSGSTEVDIGFKRHFLGADNHMRREMALTGFVAYSDATAGFRASAAGTPFFQGRLRAPSRPDSFPTSHIRRGCLSRGV